LRAIVKAVGGIELDGTVGSNVTGGFVDVEVTLLELMRRDDGRVVVSGAWTGKVDATVDGMVDDLLMINDDGEGFGWTITCGVVVGIG